LIDLNIPNADSITSLSVNERGNYLCLRKNQQAAEAVLITMLMKRRMEATAENQGRRMHTVKALVQKIAFFLRYIKNNQVKGRDDPPWFVSLSLFAEGGGQRIPHGTVTCRGVAARFGLIACRARVIIACWCVIVTPTTAW
jgi:hypothetical protein